MSAHTRTDTHGPASSAQVVELPTRRATRRVPSDSGPHAPLTVTGVREQKTSTGTPRFVVAFSDGQAYSTPDAVLADTCDVCAKAGVPVTRDLVQDGGRTRLAAVHARPIRLDGGVARLYTDPLPSSRPNGHTQ